MSVLRDGWLHLNQNPTLVRQFPPHIAEPANLLTPQGGRTPPQPNFSVTAEIHPKPAGIPDSSPDIKDEPLSSPLATTSTPAGQPTAPRRSARLSFKRSAALSPISFPSLDLSTIPGTGDLNLQLDPSTAEGSIKYQELADFAGSQLNPEVTLSQQSPHTQIGTAVINTHTNQKEVLLSVTGGSENSTLTKEELLAGPTANAQLVLQLPAKTGEKQPRSIYLGENSDTQALTDHFLRASHSPGGSSSTMSLPAESRPENQGDFSRTFETSARSGQSGLLNIRSIRSTPSAQDNQTETVVTPQSSPGGSTLRTQEEYGQRLSTGTSSYTSQNTKQLSTDNQNIQTSLIDLDYLNKHIAKAREEGEQNLKETLNKLQSDLDQKFKDKEASLKRKFEERCKQLELEQIEQEITFETQLHKETEDRKRALVEATQQELDLFIQAQQAQI